MKKGIINENIIKIILLLELIIYFSFIYLDVITKYTSICSTIMKYIGIILCLALSLIIDDRGHDKEDTKLLQIAFFFTAASDLCLVILNYNTLGIFLFCFVQITYIIRHNRGVEKRYKLYKIILIIILVLFVSKLVINNFYMTSLDNNGLNERLILIGSVYSVLLSCSLFTAWKTFSGKFYPKYSCFLISIGMTLFFLCDINVGISGLVNNIFIFGINVESVSRFLVWIFYLPSQVLLALSGYRK